MNSPQVFPKRYHLVLAILVAIIVFLILTLVAAKILSDDRPIEDYIPSFIANPAEQSSETTPAR